MGCLILPGPSRWGCQPEIGSSEETLRSPRGDAENISGPWYWYGWYGPGFADKQTCIFHHGSIWPSRTMELPGLTC